MGNGPPLSAEQVLITCARLKQLSRRERSSRARYSGDARRAYELKRILTKQIARAKWFTRLTEGAIDRGFAVTHRKLESYILATVGLGALVELSELEVHHFFLSQRSAYLPDPARARKVHQRMVTGARARQHARALQCLAVGSLPILDRGYDGFRLSVTDLQLPVKWTLSHLRSLAYECSYTPDQFDRRMWGLIEEDRKRRRR